MRRGRYRVNIRFRIRDISRVMIGSQSRVINRRVMKGRVITRGSLLDQLPQV